MQTKFEDLFFVEIDGVNFFNIKPKIDKPSYEKWLSGFSSEELDIISTVLKPSADRKQYIKTLSASKTVQYGHGQVTNTKSVKKYFFIKNNAPSKEQVSKIADYYQMGFDARNMIVQKYEQVVDEIIEFILSDQSYSKRAQKELHRHFSEDRVTEALRIQKETKYYPRYDDFDADVEEYTQSMLALLDLYLGNLVDDDLAKAFQNLFILLSYQAMHPGIFDETFSEKSARYLSIICAFIVKSLALIAAFLLFYITPLILGITLACTLISLETVLALTLFAVVMLTNIVNIIGYLWIDDYVQSHTEDNGIMAFVSNNISNFFSSAFEILFNCNIFEFEMTRILEKSKEFLQQKGYIASEAKFIADSDEVAEELPVEPSYDC